MLLHNFHPKQIKSSIFINVAILPPYLWHWKRDSIPSPLFCHQKRPCGVAVGEVYHPSMWLHSSLLHFSKQKRKRLIRATRSRKHQHCAAIINRDNRAKFLSGYISLLIVVQGPTFGVMNGSRASFFGRAGGSVTDLRQTCTLEGEEERERERECN